MYKKIALVFPVFIFLNLHQVFSQDYVIQSAEFNSKESEFSAVYCGENIIFCSARGKSNLSFADDSITNYYTDLYSVPLYPLEGEKIPMLLKGNINSNYNEGHPTFNAEGTKMFYTGNLNHTLTNKFYSLDEYRLGIFLAQKVNDEWLKIGPFEFNAVVGNYSVAHPFLSRDEKQLFFSSDMPGGFGGSDIYCCQWIDSAWTMPRNLGANINSKGNEFYPFINANGIIYFTADGRSNSEGLDIYCALPEEEGFQKSLRLNNSINSEFDDFAYQERYGQKSGCFSSNRNGEDDDIFFFTKYASSFEDCNESYHLPSRFKIDDPQIAATANLPIAFQWTMGDGSIIYGNSFEHNYANQGSYKASVKAIDTLTHLGLFDIGEYNFIIKEERMPFINCMPTVFTDVAFKCRLELEHFKDFTPDKIKWLLDDGTVYNGESFVHVFKQGGSHQIKCDISGAKINGRVPNVCVFKDVFADIAVNPNAALNVTGLQENDPYFVAKQSVTLTYEGIDSQQLLPIHKLMIARSVEPLSFNHPLFADIEGEITELWTDSVYEYAIGEECSWERLLPLYVQLKNSGFDSMRIERFNDFELKSRTLRKQFAESVVNEKIDTLLIEQDRFRIVIQSSVKRIPFNSDLFSKITEEIEEFRTDSGYKYTMLNAGDRNLLLPVLEGMKKIGYEVAQIERFSKDDIQKPIRIGKFIESNNADKLNLELSGLSEIKFDSSSTALTTESCDKLECIVEILKNVNNYNLQITAHTCNIGTNEANKKISKQRANLVTNYLVSKGVPKNRLNAIGGGEITPIASNESEVGREANRRVEFSISFAQQINTANGN